MFADDPYHHNRLFPFPQRQMETQSRNSQMVFIFFFHDVLFSKRLLYPTSQETKQECGKRRIYKGNGDMIRLQRNLIKLLSNAIISTFFLADIPKLLLECILLLHPHPMCLQNLILQTKNSKTFGPVTDHIIRNGRREHRIG